ncbi:Retrovirus-related Pol polyprotein from transposon [Dictyocoela muelleri]|nr:Retrovirus-related Pol polyprotein from transposon [Dictyocoela muelleri]
MTKRFDEVKKLWAWKLELNIPNMKEDFLLECDASNIGLGAVLKQNEKHIRYISRVLKGAERNYTIKERELLSIIWATEKLQYYLLGRRFTIFTDHKPLLEIKSKLEFGTPRTYRWLEKLSRFDFDIIYKRGSEITQSYVMSRDCVASFEDLNCTIKKNS